jgi:hypothetical protein
MIIEEINSGQGCLYLGQCRSRGDEREVSEALRKIPQHLVVPRIILF